MSCITNFPFAKYQPLDLWISHTQVGAGLSLCVSLSPIVSLAFSFSAACVLARICSYRLIPAALDALEKSQQQGTPNTFLFGVIEPTKEEMARMPQFSPPEIVEVLDYMYALIGVAS